MIVATEYVLHFVINEPRKNCESHKLFHFCYVTPSSEVDRVFNFVHKNIMWHQREFTIF